MEKSYVEKREGKRLCAEREKKKTRRSRKTEEKALRGGKMSGGLEFAALKQAEMFHSAFWEGTLSS